MQHPRQPEGRVGDPMVWVVRGYEDTDDVAGSRFNCDMCHTPEAKNARIIESSVKTIRGKPTQ